jgi:hypothetical protein
MRKIAIFGAAAILATSLAGPSMAKDMRAHHRHMAAQSMPQQQADAGWDRRDSGFWPADVAAGAVGAAAGVAGAAIGTAGAIATAPFQPMESYAYAPGPNGAGPITTYDHGPNGYYGDWTTYAARNGIVCRPGTLFKGDDGRQHLCQ